MTKADLGIELKEEQVQEQQQPKGESPKFTGEIDLGILGTHSIALWINKDQTGKQPILQGGIRKKNQEGNYYQVARVALWDNQREEG